MLHKWKHKTVVVALIALVALFCAGNIKTDVFATGTEVSAVANNQEKSVSITIKNSELAGKEVSVICFAPGWNKKPTDLEGNLAHIAVLDQVTLDDSGVMAMTYPLRDNSPEGTYTVAIGSETSDSQKTQEFTIGAGNNSEPTNQGDVVADAGNNGNPTNQGDIVAKETLKPGTTFTSSDGILKYKVLKSAAGNSLGTVQVTKVAKQKTKISIPAQVTDPKTKQKFRVTSIGANAFKGNKKITKVSIGNEIETIGASAFSGCKKLSSVTIGKKVKKIESKAFYNCKKLKKITVKSTKLKKVGKKAIKGIFKKAVIKAPKKQVKAYNKLFSKKTGRTSSMKIKK